MTAYAVLEQQSLHSNPQMTAVGRARAPHLLVSCKTFADGEEFSLQLRACVTALLQVADDVPKLLVISAHGIPLTGTELETSENESLNLWAHAIDFAGLPQSILVYISACFGAYPSARAIQERSTMPPCVVGPLVDIRPEHANALQSRLLDVLGGEYSLRAMVRLIAAQNKLHRLSYEGREVFGLYDGKKRFFPSHTSGAQLAAPVAERTTYEIVQVMSRTEAGAITHCRISDEGGNMFVAGVAPLLKLVDSAETLVGRRFIGRHQVLGTDADICRVCLVQVRRR